MNGLPTQAYDCCYWPSLLLLSRAMGLDEALRALRRAPTIRLRLLGLGDDDLAREVCSRIGAHETCFATNGFWELSLEPHDSEGASSRSSMSSSRRSPFEL